jgi:hypothetical protein
MVRRNQWKGDTTLTRVDTCISTVGDCQGTEEGEEPLLDYRRER